MSTQSGLPAGVRRSPLNGHRDLRGGLTELFRNEWDTGITPIQWTLASSAANVLRGVHVHVLHTDYLIFLNGRSAIGLADLRPDSPTAGLACLLELNGQSLEALTIPPGVAHGFYMHEASQYLVGVDRYYNPADEMGCQWSDPALGITWPVDSPIVSERDATAPSLSRLQQQLSEHPAVQASEVSED